MANRATIQTGMANSANSIDDAADARAAATTAMAEAGKALAAYTQRVAAGNVHWSRPPSGRRPKPLQGGRQSAQTAAETARDDAVADSMVELKIDGTVKSVGDTTIDAEASSSVVTTDGETVDTGLQKNDLRPMTDGPSRPLTGRGCRPVDLTLQPRRLTV